MPLRPPGNDRPRLLSDAPVLSIELFLGFLDLGRILGESPLDRRRGGFCFADETSDEPAPSASPAGTAIMREPRLLRLSGP